MKKTIFIFDQFKAVNKKIHQQSRIFIFLTIFLLAFSFLFLLLPGNLYVFIVDVSGSMADEMPSNENRKYSKIEALKNALHRFLDKRFEGEYMLVTYGNNGVYRGTPITNLDSLLNYPEHEKFGGNILLHWSDNKEFVKSKLAGINSEAQNTHLSEALLKLFYYIEKSNFHSFRNLVFIVFGDGDDQNNSISEERSVIRNDKIVWSFTDKMKLHTVLVGEIGSGRENLHILAKHGNGISVDVNYVEEFYNKILQLTKDEFVIYVHIVLCLLIIIVISSLLLRW